MRRTVDSRNPDQLIQIGSRPSISPSGLAVDMSSVIKKFFIASMFMWAAPVAILYGFNHNILPGSTHLSSYSMTLLSGFLAVISVNIVIACYICMAMKEPSDKHEPDPAFLASAKASLSQKPNEVEDSSQTRQKEE
ncbi:uncharacterized protein LOC131310634 isoform X1 [Rhododendron vialii]|uniref:uncharacterized protein LOC131310634 isoform X1 n=1 Tax=Rhododendron vialii TaxID=182163 RepID=UPI00265E1D38|nr:uncharacterized protein LOC131310634 isoform X1 [Rhododendron vialii]